MLAIAQTLGYSETAFLATNGGNGDPVPTRYFSPRAEVDFCGHATVAAAVAIAERGGVGQLLLHTNAGPVDVVTAEDEGGITATLTSPPTTTQAADDETLRAALEALRISDTDLDPRYPPHVSYRRQPPPGARPARQAGSRRPQLRLPGARTADVPAVLDHRASVLGRAPHALPRTRPVPPGGVREDPATGAAAAAFGGYLRDLALVPVPTQVVIRQGVQMGAPSRLLVDISADSHQVAVTGTAIRIPLSPYDDLDQP